MGDIILNTSSQRRLSTDPLPHTLCTAMNSFCTLTTSSGLCIWDKGSYLIGYWSGFCVFTIAARVQFPASECCFSPGLCFQSPKRVSLSVFNATIQYLVLICPVTVYMNDSKDHDKTLLLFGRTM